MNTANLLVSLYALGLYDQQASLAVGKHKAPAPVATLATDLGNAQTALNTGIAGLAEKNSVSLPQTLSSDQQQRLQGMIQPGRKNGRSYVRQITNDQKQMLVTLQEAAKSNDTDVIHWAQDATSRIQEMAEKTGTVQRYLGFRSPGSQSLTRSEETYPRDEGHISRGSVPNRPVAPGSRASLTG